MVRSLLLGGASFAHREIACGSACDRNERVAANVVHRGVMESVKRTDLGDVEKELPLQGGGAAPMGTT
jgi:hypothetical protein